MDYTKGEWEADIRAGVATVHIKDDEEYYCLDGKRDECIYWAHGRWSDGRWNLTEEAEANARLIAAAPRCYEELKVADQVICELCKRLNPQHVTMDNGRGCNRCKDRDDRLDAIAKAEGK